MSIEESRQRRAAKAQAEPQTPQATPTLDMEVIRQVIREALASELEAQAQPPDLSVIEAGLQRIYTELAEMRALLKSGAATVQAPAQRNDDQADSFYEDDDQEEERGDEAAQTWNVLPARSPGLQRHSPNPQDPEPIILGAGQRRQGGQS